MFKFFDKIVDKVQDHVLDYIEKYLDEDMKPAFRAKVEELVRQFRATIEERVPQQVGRQLEDQDDSKITGIIGHALSGRVERLLERLLEHFRPEVEKATESLSDTITEESMVRVKAFLGVGDKAQATPEPGARGLSLPGVGQVDFSQTVGNFLGVNERMPTLEKDLHERFQPISATLRTTLWEKFILVLNAALKECFPFLDLPVAGDVLQHTDRSWFGDRIDDIQEALQGKITEHVPDLYEALQDPVGEIIADLVKWLEDHSVNTCVEKVRETVKHLDLVRPEAAQ